MSLRAVLNDPERMVTVHTWLTVGWLVLTNVTAALALYLGESPFMAWVIWMSGYANAGAHWSARQGAAPSAKEAS